MTFIDFLPWEEVPEEDQVADQDNIIRIHSVNRRTIRHHFELYRELMYGKSPLSRIQREMIAVVVSAENRCHY